MPKGRRAGGNVRQMPRPEPQPQHSDPTVRALLQNYAQQYGPMVATLEGENLEHFLEIAEIVDDRKLDLRDAMTRLERFLHEVRKQRRKNDG